ncbi:MAG: hypothetical protein WBX15_03505 [Thermoanaerobaculia bacterium]
MKRVFKSSTTVFAWLISLYLFVLTPATFAAARIMEPMQDGASSFAPGIGAWLPHALQTVVTVLRICGDVIAVPIP